MKWLKKYPSNSIIFHHRFPTSTENVRNACHPFSTRDKFKTNYVLVHNGHISNAHQLMEKHKQMGIEYYSVQPDGRFNDSEALLWDFALFKEGKQEKLEARGGIAFICLALHGDKRKHDRLYFGRNNNPLNVYHDPEVGITIASEGHGELIEADKLYEFNTVNGKLTSSELEIPSYYVNYGSYQTVGRGMSGEYDDYEDEFLDDDFYENMMDEEYLTVDKDGYTYDYRGETYYFEIKDLLKYKVDLERAVEVQRERIFDKYMTASGGSFKYASYLITKDIDKLLGFNNFKLFDVATVHHGKDDFDHTLELYFDVADEIDHHPMYSADTSVHSNYAKPKYQIPTKETQQRLLVG